MNKISDIAAYVHQNPPVVVGIDGSTDLLRGTNQYNVALSQRRVANVREPSRLAQPIERKKGFPHRTLIVRLSASRARRSAGMTASEVGADHIFALRQ